MADSDPESGREEYLDKGLSWDKRLELARARRAQVEAERGPTPITLRLKPWESEAADAAGAETPALPEYPDIPPARQAAVIARLKAESTPVEVRASGKVVRLAERPAIEIPEPVPAPPPVGKEEAIAVVNRLLSAPPAAAAPARGARFDSIRPAEVSSRGWFWLVALACLLGGLAAGLLLAVVLFFSIGAQVKAPDGARPALVAAILGKAAPASARPGATADRPEPTAQADEARLNLADAQFTAASPARIDAARPSAGLPVASTLNLPLPAGAPDAPALPGADAPLVLAGAASDAGPRRQQADLTGPAAEDPAQVPLPAQAPGAVTAVAPLADAPAAGAAPALSAQPAPMRLDRAAALAAAAPHEAIPAIPRARAPAVAALAPAMVPAPLPIGQVAPVAAEAALVRSAYARPAAPVLPDPAFACVDCALTEVVTAGKTVRLRLPGALARNERLVLRGLLQDAGFARVVPAIEQLPVHTSQVRYFRPEDADAARLLAELTRAELFDLSWFSPRPAGGTIEVLIAVEGVSGALPPG